MASCPSCHQENADNTPYCEACGAALPDDNEESLDDALSLMLGLVCPHCDSYNDPGTLACALCGQSISDTEAPAPAAPAPAILAPAILAPAILAPATPAPATPAPATSPTTPAAAPPSWMQAPEGQPLATANAMPAVDLSVVSEGQGGLSAPTGSDPSIPVQPPADVVAGTPSAAPGPKPVVPADCIICGGDVRANDKFCRHCGGRLDEADTKQTPLPKAPVGAGLGGGGATMVMPSLILPTPNLSTPGLSTPGLAPAAAPSATMFFGAASVERFARLTLVKGHTQFGTQWRLQAGETVIGRSSGMVLFPDDSYLAARHCRVEFRGEDLYLVPEDERNGVYLRIRQPENLPFGGDIVIGVQRLKLIGPAELPRALALPQPGDDTKLLGSAFREDTFAVRRIFQDPSLSEVYFRPQRVLSIGRARCDVNFPDDPFMSTRHAQLTRTNTGAQLEDLGSRNGTFIRLTSDRKLSHGDVIMLGEQVLRVEVSLSLSR